MLVGLETLSACLVSYSSSKKDLGMFTNLACLQIPSETDGM